METMKVKAELRPDKSTKRSLSELRESRKIPGVIYGGKGGSVSVTVGEKELMHFLKVGGANAIITLQHGGKEDTVIVKDLQRHVVTGRPIHADFQRIAMHEKIEVQVPLHLLGEAPGVKTQGGVLDQALRELSVRCLPNAIPQQIEVDVSTLEIGDSISVKELRVPPDVEVLNEPDQLVAHILTVKVEEEPAPAEEAAPAEGEPEVIEKGKKEEAAEGEAEGGEAKPAPKGKAEEPKKEGSK